jgi:hypothetical protein
MNTSTTWELPAYAGHWLSDEDVTAVTDWLQANGARRASFNQPIVVANGVIRFGQDHSDSTVRARHRDVRQCDVPLRTEPPNVTRPNVEPRVLLDLVSLFEQHEWSAGFGNQGGVCVDCSPIVVRDGKVYCRVNDVMPWPCPPVRAAMNAANVPIPGPSEPTPRMLGDCLDPAAQARAFAHLDGER